MVDHFIKIRRFEDTIFLPKEVNNLFDTILDAHQKIHKMAQTRNVQASEFSGEEAPNEYFPSLPLHSSQKIFEADKSKIKEEPQCNKEYPSAPKLTPGVAHVFCRHNICKGFTTMVTPERPEMFMKFLQRRLPVSLSQEEVRRIMLYDNSCNAHKYALNRDANNIWKFRIFTLIGKIMLAVVRHIIVIGMSTSKG